MADQSQIRSERMTELVRLMILSEPSKYLNTELFTSMIPHIEALALQQPNSELTDESFELLGQLTSLTSLKFNIRNDSKVSAASLNHLSSLTNLKCLEAYAWSLETKKNSEYLKNMHHLTSLNACVLSDNFSVLENLTNLKLLDIKTNIVNGEFFNYISAFKELELLCIVAFDATSVDIGKLSGCTKLKTLKLDDFSAFSQSQNVMTTNKGNINCNSHP